MNDKEKYTVEFQNYAIVKGRVILFDVDLGYLSVFNEFEKITSAGLVCIWKRGDVQHVICSNESVFFPILSKPEIDQQLIAVHMGIPVNRV
ncbi:hypothetical protein [Pedobacter cryoconitis]|uniref:Uncharacterized protein n=1 Tax=Pedobacter cryoconitis TaxID=188932 RepID=A0A7X0J4E2_9SPHI|nr:hypothetical protein [Pedobacter cryoconitis]MBB6500939.1 hypothetical protein [Pedobacter cryoconitis]